MAEKVHSTSTTHESESNSRHAVADLQSDSYEIEPLVEQTLLPGIDLRPQLLPRVGGGPRETVLLNLQRTIGNRAVQRAIQRARSAESGDDLAQRIQVASAGGSGLEAATRDRLEPGLGADLSSVRIHTDAEADRLSRAVEATAFTTGQDIFFRSGSYDPTSSQGLHLLAHEATHTIQQANGPVAGTPAPGGVSISDPADSFEQAAERAAYSVLSGAPAAPQTAGNATVQRQAAPEEEEELVQTRRADASTVSMQRQAAPEEEEMVQTRRADASTVSIQRQAAPEEEEIVQTRRVDASTVSIQRQAVPEEEEMVQPRRVDAPAVSIQRDTKPDPTKSGWTDASKGSAQTSQPDVKAPKDTSWNAGETQIGSIRRIPIEGLTIGNKSKSENLGRRGSTPESAIGKAVVLMPDDFNPKEPTTVLLHLHGYGSGYRQLDDPEELKKQLKTLNDEKTALETERDAASKRADKDKVKELRAKLRQTAANIRGTKRQIADWKLDYAGVLQPGQVRDVELYRMEQQLDELHKEHQKQKKETKKSGPQIMAVLPQGTSSSGFGDISAKPTEYLDEVFGTLRVKPTDFHVALSGHSGGGVPVMNMAATLAKKEKAGEKPPQVDEIILFDAINGSAESGTVVGWLNKHIEGDIKALKKMNTPEEVDNHFKARPRFRGYFSAGYKALYEDVKNLTDGLSTTKIEVPKPGKKTSKEPHPLQEYIRNKLTEQYQVIGPIGEIDKKDFGPHERLIGTKHDPTKAGILHEALSALPVQPMRTTVPTLPVQRHPDGKGEGSVPRQESTPASVPTAVAQPPSAAGAQTAVQDPTADDDFVNQTIESFGDDELKKQIGDKIKNRRDFLVGMQQYLGTLDDVINHFKLIRQANVPGEVHLHEKAAKRLEMVAEKLGKEGMPGTTVALGLRDRYHPHTKHGRGLMAHPCGFAIDFRAEANPHITDPRLVKLLAMRTGGATRLELGKYGERRDLIKRMGEQSAKGGIDPDSPLGREAAGFQARLEDQYKRVSEASKAFRAELAGTRSELLRTYTQLQKIEKDLSKIPKLRKNPKKYGKTTAEVDQEEQDLRKQRQELREKTKPELPRLFKPWLDQINNEVQSLEAQIKKVAPGSDLASLPSKQDLATREREVQRAYGTAARQRKQAEHKIKELRKEVERDQKLNSDSEKLIEGWEAAIAKSRADADSAGAKQVATQQKQKLEKRIENLMTKKSGEQKRMGARAESIAKLNAEIEDTQRIASEHGKHESDANQTLESIKRQKDALPQVEELKTLRGLKESLSSDLAFVFEGRETVSDPGVAQLLEKGFFTPDPDRNKGERFDSDKHGFNLLFLKTMTEHGFDLGASWNPGSADPMHLELVEGVEMIRDVKKAEKQKAAEQKKAKSVIQPRAIVAAANARYEQETDQVAKTTGESTMIQLVVQRAEAASSSLTNSQPTTDRPSVLIVDDSAEDQEPSQMNHGNAYVQRTLAS